MITALLVGAALTVPVLDKWEIRAPVAPGTKLSWKIAAKAEMSDGTHEASFVYALNVADRKDGEPIKAQASWKELVVDGNAMDEDNLWDLELGKHGGIVGASGDEPSDLVRMLSAMTLAYPNESVDVGSKWIVESGAITYDVAAAALEKVKDVDALKITGKITEKGEGGMVADGTWWVDKVGKLLKFEVQAKNWAVPMAGPDRFNATLKGELS